MTVARAASVEEPSRLSHFAMGVVAVCLAILLGAVYTYGVAARATYERAEAARIEQENRAFCAGLGLAENSEPYTRCTGGLTAIRQRQREHFDAESAGYSRGATP